MKKAAMLFPGQGSQFVGMGKDLVEAYPRIAEIYREADETLGRPISRLCFGGEPEVLTETRNAQPAILLHSVAVATVLREEGGVEPAIAAGHSLGEYSALAASGVLDPMDALRIVRKRGELMFEAGLEQPGTMAAVIGLEPDVVAEVCAGSSTADETVVVANLNSPGQIVVSGHIPAVERAMEAATEAGAKKAVQLNVSGAFHSPLVASAQDELVSFIDQFEFRPARAGIVANADARIVREKDEIVDALSRQLTSPVRWTESMQLLLGEWEGEIMEIGPGKVLTGLMRRIDRSRPVETVGTAAALEKYAAPEIEIA